MRILAATAAVALASVSALAADTLAIDSVAGVYKFSHTLTAIDAPSYTAEDVLEIVRVSPQRAYIRTHLYFTNGHECSLYGVANLNSGALTYSTKEEPSGDVCELPLRVENGRVVFHDKDSKCMQHNCGMRGSFEGIGFALSGRRDIRYMPRLLASREYKGALAEAGVAPAAASATANVPTVAPMHSEASVAHYPRITGLANAVIQQKVNAIFAAREKASHDDRKGCFDLIRDAGQHPSDDNFSVRIDVHYVSRRYVSLEVRNSYDCAGAYPNNGIPQPLTVDLTTGKEVNWRPLFEKGFFADDTKPDDVPFLTELYQKRYATEGGAADPECKRVVSESTGEMFVWLDAKRGLVVQPDFPHALQACGDEIAFSPVEIGDYIEVQEFYDDLKATVHR